MRAGVRPRKSAEALRRSAASAELTADGRALLEELAAAVAPVIREVFADHDRNDLAAAHRVLVELIERAGRMTSGD